MHTSRCLSMSSSLSDRKSHSFSGHFFTNLTIYNFEKVQTKNMQRNVLEPVILVAVLDIALHLVGKAKAGSPYTKAVSATARDQLFRYQSRSLENQRRMRRNERSWGLQTSIFSALLIIKKI